MQGLAEVSVQTCAYWFQSRVHTNMEEIEEMTILSLGIGTASKHSRSSTNFRETDQKLALMKKGCEIEMKVRSSRLEDQDNSHMRKKLRLSEEQLKMLENLYQDDSNLHPALKQGLAEKLNIKPRQVEVWFQNRRARTKHKQIEQECKNLKRWLEGLKKENQRLKMELMRVSRPVLPLHDNTHDGSKVAVMCSSCNNLHLRLSQSEENCQYNI